MATKTSVGSGKWSVAGTWDAGVPADGDDVVIATGHTVEFDVDQSAFTTGVKVTITGTLTHTTAAGSYCLFLKTGASVVGAGTWNIGTSGAPIPFASKHTVTGAAGWYVDGVSGLTMTVYAAEPTTKIIYLSGVEAIGQTVLSVDTDVTGDIWAAGDTIRINDIQKFESEERVIAAGGIAAGEITITAGLTAQKEIGSSVILCTRNVTIIANGSDPIKSFLDGKLTIAGGHITAAARTAISGGYCTFSGGIINNASYGISSTATMTGGVITACSYGLTGTKITISGGIFSGNNHAVSTGNDVFVSGGLFVCNNNCFYLSNIISLLGGTYTKNGKLSERCTGVIASNIVTSLHTQDANWTNFIANNVGFGGLIENVNYTLFSKYVYSESIDHDQVSGAYKAWTVGGVTTKQAVTVPVGYSSAMQTVLESATFEGYWQKEITVGAGASVNIEMNLRKDASMTYLPRCIIFNKATTDPFAGGTGLYTFTMTNSVDTWEDDLYTYTNSGSEDVTLVIRCQGMNATGNMYSALDIEQINVDLTSATALINAIKAKTDQLAFTVANQVDANALTGGGGATAEDVRLEMDANSTKLAAILEDTGTDGVVLKAAGLAADAVTKIQNGLATPTNITAGTITTVTNLTNAPTDMAKESTLTAIKGATWSDETLVAINAALEAIDLSGVAAAVWAAAVRTLTQSAASVVAVVSGSDITCQRGDSLSISLTDVGALTGYSKVYFTVKRDTADADTASIIQIEKTAGLKYLNGAVGTPANGSLTIDDEASGDITIALDETETAKLDPGVYSYDVQVVRTAGTVSTLTEGTFTVAADITRATA